MIQPKHEVQDEMEMEQDSDEPEHHMEHHDERNEFTSFNSDSSRDRAESFNPYALEEK